MTVDVKIGALELAEKKLGRGRNPGPFLIRTL